MSEISHYYKTKVKCVRCTLHFILLTWNSDLNGELKKVSCPLCGERDLIVWQELVTGFIFEEVPGESRPYEK